MAERVFGLETEYAFGVLGPAGPPLDRKTALSRLMELARTRLPHLPGQHNSGIFLASGGRFYQDSGNHPELTTPEVLNPWDACRYLLAGEHILAGLAAEVAPRDGSGARVLFYRGNVCYSGTQATWACHESYGHGADPAVLPQHLIPHLVSRLIYTGAGGFNNRSFGLEFMLSPRVAHLEREISSDSTHNRGIFHTKNETLSGTGCNRLHILCGESLCSETATWLKMGTTALVVALIEAGLRPGDGVRLGKPLEAMRRFSTDEKGRARAGVAGGKSLTAVEIQRNYLELVEAHAQDAFMPSWAPEVCRRWRDILDRLEQGPGSVAKTLDWAIKRALYQEFARRKGIAWESLPHWNEVLNKLGAALRQKGNAGRDITLAVLAKDSPVAAEVKQLTPMLKDQGLSWDGLGPLLALRQELFELDTRFGQLDSQGIFQALDRSGVLAHHMPGVDNIEHAMAGPPASGRAHLRGECIRRFWGNNGQYTCDWMGVWDHQRRRYLDLSDPFAAEERWQDLPPDVGFQAAHLQTQFRDLLDQVLTLYNRGHYEAAYEMLSTLQRFRTRLDPRQQADYNRYLSWVQTRRGFLDGPATLEQIARPEPLTIDAINDLVCLYRFQGLAPVPAIHDWLRRGEELLAQNPDQVSDNVLTFLGHVGYTRLHQGRPRQALAALEAACHPDRRQVTHARIVSRTLADLAEAHRMLGKRQSAHRYLDEAESIQVSQQFEGDLADFTLTYRAKLETEPDRALTWLEKAKAIQLRLRNYPGEARSLLLEARLVADAEMAEVRRTRFLELAVQRPALAQCQMVACILNHWEAWVEGGLSPEGHEDFFWCL